MMGASVLELRKKNLPVWNISSTYSELLKYFELGSPAISMDFIKRLVPIGRG